MAIVASWMSGVGSPRPLRKEDFNLDQVRAKSMVLLVSSNDSQETDIPYGGDRVFQTTIHATTEAADLGSALLLHEYL